MATSVNECIKNYYYYFEARLGPGPWILARFTFGRTLKNMFTNLLYIHSFVDSCNHTYIVVHSWQCLHLFIYCSDVFIYAFTHSLTPACVHSFIASSLHSFFLSCIHSFNHTSWIRTYVYWRRHAAWHWCLFDSWLCSACGERRFILGDHQLDLVWSCLILFDLGRSTRGEAMQGVLEKVIRWNTIFGRGRSLFANHRKHLQDCF